MALLLRLRRMLAFARLKRLSPGSTPWFIEAEIKFVRTLYPAYRIEKYAELTFLSQLPSG